MLFRSHAAHEVSVLGVLPERDHVALEDRQDALEEKLLGLVSALQKDVDEAHRANTR